MDGILFLHNQAGEALMRATDTIAALRARVAELEAEAESREAAQHKPRPEWMPEPGATTTDACESNGPALI